MIIFPQAKINLGLNVVARRADGYHDLQTVFFSVPLCDALEVQPMDDAFPSAVSCDLKLTGIKVDGDERRNLVVKAYEQLRHDFPQLPRLHIHLHKAIPAQAGMGGGSSDATAMLCLLNEWQHLGLNRRQLIERAMRLGADCPFFVLGGAAYAEGIGERLEPIALDLHGWHLGVVRPPVPVSTKEAFALIRPQQPLVNCREVVMQPVEQWRELLVNDFERSIFVLHPEIAAVKEQLYDLGAVYSAMSGSGSAVFGLFRSAVDLAPLFPGMFTAMMSL